MLSKADRLSTNEFNLAVKNGHEAFSQFFTIRFLSAGKLKISCAAPKKIFKTAVSRNRIRRRIYGVVREILSAKKIKPYFIVLIVKKDITNLANPSLIREIQNLFVQARLFA